MIYVGFCRWLRAGYPGQANTTKTRICTRTSRCIATVATIIGASSLAPLCDAFEATPIPIVNNQASDSDSLTGSLTDQQTYDSNLFRVPTGSEFAGLIGPNHSREDHINDASAELDGHWGYRRQSVDLKLLVDNSHFSSNSDLNNTALDGRPVWNWNLGPTLSGQVVYEYTRSLASFANTRYFARDTVIGQQAFGMARYQIGPRIALYANATDSKTSNSASLEKINDFNDKATVFGAEYATAVNDTFGLEYDRNNGTYTSNAVIGGVIFDRDYIENLARVVAHYSFTEKTSIIANAGYLKRTYPSSTVGSFSGTTWRMSMQWSPTDKLQFPIAAWHELQAYLDSQSNYFVSKGESISPVWTLSEKFSVSGLVSFSRQDYIGSSLSVITLGSRRDKLTSEQISFNYTPISPLTLKLMYRDERRNSNQPTFAYIDRVTSVSFSFAF